LRLVPFVIGLLVTSSSLVGCKKREADKANQAQGGPSDDAAKKSLEALKPLLAAQDEKYLAMRNKLEALPTDLPGYGEFRAKFYAIEEGRGIMGVKHTWLSERLDSARKSGKPEDLSRVAKDIAKMHDELRQIDQLALEFTHQLSGLERAAARQAKEVKKGTGAILRILPTNYEVWGNANGVEQRLLEFVEDPKRKVDQNLWFDFDQVLFSGIGAELDRPLSKHQLENVSQILKAYPTVKLMVGGFMDDTGDPAAIQKLSAERAQAIKAELVRLGVAEARLGSKGYGREQPRCPANDTDDCKGMNRRVAVQITAR
jgi:outer membrane protein OmpA-like peptidoglycan-associated protein